MVVTNREKKATKTDLNSIVMIIALNVNGLNTVIKIQRLSNWININKTHLYAVYKNPMLNIET